MLYSDTQSYDPFNDRALGTEYKFTWFPQKCYISGKKLWLQNAYRRTAMWTGPGTPVIEHRWYDKDEFLIARIKGEI